MTSPTDDPIHAHLASLARNTLAAAPRPAPPAVIRILAERRRAELRSRRLLTIVALATAAPMVVVLAAWILRPAPASGASLAAVILAGALVPAIEGIARLAGVSPPRRW